MLILLSISLVIGTGASAGHWHGGGWHGGGWHGGGWHGGGWNRGWHGGGWGGYGGWGYGGGDFVGAAVGLAAMSMILNQSNRYYGAYPYRGYYNNQYYRGYKVYCRIVRGHYDYYGYWVPRHRVCWR